MKSDALIYKNIFYGRGGFFLLIVSISGTRSSSIAAWTVRRWRSSVATIFFTARAVSSAISTSVATRTPLRRNVIVSPLSSLPVWYTKISSYYVSINFHSMSIFFCFFAILHSFIRYESKSSARSARTRITPTDNIAILDGAVSSKDSVYFSLICFVTQVEDSYGARFWWRWSPSTITRSSCICMTIFSV